MGLVIIVAFLCDHNRLTPGSAFNLAGIALTRRCLTRLVRNLVYYTPNNISAIERNSLARRRLNISATLLRGNRG